MKTIKNLGEFGLIERFAKEIKTDMSVKTGIGDDTAVIKDGRHYLLFTTDMLVEDVHFSLKTARPQQIGWKAVCCSISDIAAMGGVPRWMMVSCGLPRSATIKFIDKIYSGIKKAASLYSVNIVGGDTVKSKKLVLDVGMIGVKKNRPLLRSGARIGDAIFVTGTLGGAVKSGRHLNFKPRLNEAQYLVKNFKISSMIDISDGLSSDLAHILKRSKVGAALDTNSIPVSCGSSLKSALSEGEDFELLFTLPQKQAKRLPVKIGTVQLTRIGRIIREKKGSIMRDARNEKGDTRRKRGRKTNAKKGTEASCGMRETKKGSGTFSGTFFKKIGYRHF